MGGTQAQPQQAQWRAQSTMRLKTGIVGMPNVGKSTLFNAVTEAQGAMCANYPFATIEPNIGVVEVPDARWVGGIGVGGRGGDRVGVGCGVRGVGGGSMCASYPFATIEPNTGVVEVPNAKWAGSGDR